MAAVIVKPVKLLAALAALALAAGAIVFWAPGFSQVAPTFPSPNGCADFARAGQLVNSFPGSSAPTNRQELQTYLENNAESLRLIWEGLTKECRTSWGAGTNGVRQHMDELASLKQLARLLESRARLAELEGHPADAARIHLKTIRFGNEAIRGGVVIDKLVGVAIENLGTLSLERLGPQLDPSTRREIADGIKQIDERRESVEDVLLHERQWRRVNSTWYQRLVFSLPVRPLNPTRRIEQNLNTKISQQKTREDQLVRALKD